MLSRIATLTAAGLVATALGVGHIGMPVSAHAFPNNPAISGGGDEASGDITDPREGESDGVNWPDRPGDTRDPYVPPITDGELPGWGIPDQPAGDPTDPTVVDDRVLLGGDSWTAPAVTCWEDSPGDMVCV